MTTWDERFRAGQYPHDPDPSPVLRAYIDAIPDGLALDIATGTGRNAVFLADRGYRVEALKMARKAARDHGVHIELIQADATAFRYPESRYALVTISFYRALDRLSDIKDALEPGGYLFCQHHLRSTGEATVGPSTDRYRFAANEMLRSCLDLTVLYYEESTERVDDGTAATTTIVARNTSGPRQSYPPSPFA